MLQFAKSILQHSLTSCSESYGRVFYIIIMLMRKGGEKWPLRKREIVFTSTSSRKTNRLNLPFHIWWQSEKRRSLEKLLLRPIAMFNGALKTPFGMTLPFWKWQTIVMAREQLKVIIISIFFFLPSSEILFHLPHPSHRK